VNARTSASAPRLALHAWTLDTTPLPDVVAAAKTAGWDAVELRRLDWTRAREAGRPPTWVEDTVRASGVPVACVGVEFGWMWTDGAERVRLLAGFDEQCARAKALGCQTVMSPVDKGRGDVARAAASVREVGDIAARHGVRLAVEFNSQCEQLDTLERVREVLAKAAHPRCGLLFDAYHMQRSGGSPRSLDDVRGEEIVYVQFSDVPRGDLKRGEVLNRLAPGQGCVPFKEFFAAVRAKGYAGFMSYEAPNPEAWARPPSDVAREALAATRAAL
jgi:2-keto-myo-inositol isomerase